MECSILFSASIAWWEFLLGGWTRAHERACLSLSQKAQSMAQQQPWRIVALVCLLSSGRGTPVRFAPEYSVKVPLGLAQEQKALAFHLNQSPWALPHRR